ncbi:YbaB/EbfC family DNA-binding protein [Stenotrophomonas tumulicola]|uniref:YbaB/EbfC family DNA-binding protein n=1 Tax=Stenotrophomonas tumulicola TaxID=1685415 RepID=A0A7W3FM53_9GAMM|nr:YbaB/EbfC family DNA-binding protein [Stenotrophomonas tumulicola]MBA8681781.1 YbaB/EbfC family DNA-binding protein [Stenotrophomonas tumulicola]
MSDMQGGSRQRNGNPGIDAGPATQKQGWLARLRLRLFAGAAMAAAAGTLPVQAQVPEHWISFATMAGEHLQARLGSAPDTLIARLQQRTDAAHTGEAARQLVVRLWIADDGKITRSDFDSLGDARVDADLRALLAAEPLPQAPPPDMLQPLVLGLKLQPSADADVAAPGGPGVGRP